jgi:hemoglobin
MNEAVVVMLALVLIALLAFGAAALGRRAFGAATRAPRASARSPLGPAKARELRHATREPTLYDRLGGVFAIAAVVNHFSDALITNPIAGRDSENPYLRDWYATKLDRLPGLKFMRTLWLCAVSGGPFEYSPTRPGRCPFGLENAHRALQISPAEFDAVAAELANTLAALKVPGREAAEVLEAFAAHKSEVVAGYDAARGAPNVPRECSSGAPAMG